MDEFFDLWPRKPHFGKTSPRAQITPKMAKNPRNYVTAEYCTWWPRKPNFEKTRPQSWFSRPPRFRFSRPRMDF